MIHYEEKPRKPDIIKNEIRELDLSIISSKKWLKKNPKDPVLNLLVEQHRVRKQKLISELSDSYKEYRFHNIIYALKTDLSVNVKSLSKLLSTFENVINSTLKKLPKTKEIESLNLYFDSVVQSSFGVLMSTDWDSELFDTGIERTFDRFFDILEVLKTNPEIEDDKLINEFLIDKELLRKYRTFFLGVSAYNKSIQISWDSHLKKRSFLLEPKWAEDSLKKLIELEQPTTEDFEDKGSIQGISLINKTLQFSPHKKTGAIIKLDFDESFNEDLKPLLGEIVTLKYRVSVEYDQVKDKTIKRQFLLNIIESDT